MPAARRLDDRLAVLARSIGPLVFGATGGQALAQRATQPPGGHVQAMRVPYDGVPVTRRIVIGADKSTLLELPVDLTNVMVSNPEVVDAVIQSSRQLYLLGKGAGEANVILIGPDDRRVMQLEITVARDLTSLVAALRRLLPGSRIRAEMVGDNVVLSGSVADPQDSSRAAELAGRFIKKKDNVVNMIAVAAKEQVMLRVKVAEMQRDAIRRIGVNLPGAILKEGNISIAEVFRNGFPITSTAVAAAFPGAAGGLPGVAGGRATQFNWSNGSNSATALLQMLEQTGAMRTLAEPNLTAMSGETAKFLAGGEYPIPMAAANGQISIEFKPFGVNVMFKPVVLTEGRISLAITAEVSEIAPETSVSAGVITVPGLKVRRAETTLEIPSGGTLAMAGLLSEDTRQNVEGVPGLKNLPVLGQLFRSNDYRKRETELIILVTPTLATHGQARDFATPGQHYRAASELRELLWGRLNRLYGRNPGGQSGGSRVSAAPRITTATTATSSSFPISGRR